ncbi:hypothetical protein Rs2_49657 [Raphanus sativus]|nr:hypothetical protein Rs2_49657 [Raphanus sativus]
MRIETSLASGELHPGMAQVQCWFVLGKRKTIRWAVRGCVRRLQRYAGWHSMRSFVEIQNLNDAKVTALSWALDSMVAHRVGKLILGIEDPMMCGILERPKAWPSFRVESSALLE